MQDEYTIQLKDDAILMTPRRVPIPLMRSVKAKLDNMERLGIISHIDTLTDWCAGMVESDNRVRICVDLTNSMRV